MHRRFSTEPNHYKHLKNKLHRLIKPLSDFKSVWERSSVGEH